MSTGVVWFRRDLRLTANPAWSAATRNHSEVVALFVVDPPLWDRCSPTRVALLAGHLRSLDEALATRGGRLRVEHGDPVEVVGRVARHTGADAVVANADVTPYAHRRDAAVAETVDLDLHDGTLIHAPGTVLTADGTRYRVFTPFSRKWFELPIGRTPAPGVTKVRGETADGVPETTPPPIEPGEEAALARFAEFDPDRYASERDRPDLDSTSRVSIDLKFGTLSPVTVHDLVGRTTESRRAFIRQLAWRDFHAHLMDESPTLVDRAMKPAYDRVQWRDDPAGLSAWRRGMTGYPIVDAGMRQLLAEGWMHNRVRLISASFLVKDLLVDWRWGERWFRHQLLDGDIAQNVGNWQWVTGSGADAAPYFRIFNPVTQSERFDPGGDYVRRWIPELNGVPSEFIHAPWRAGPVELAGWGAERYPPPIVDHAAARERTLDAYRAALG
jgi:deoxyribodipyrimidine photo-lyase